MSNAINPENPVNTYAKLTWPDKYSFTQNGMAKIQPTDMLSSSPIKKHGITSSNFSLYITSDIYLESTALNGASASNEKINMYSTVHENSSLCAYPILDIPRTFPITIRDIIIRSIGAIDKTVLYTNPASFDTIEFLPYIL